MLNENWYMLIEYFISDPRAKVNIKSVEFTVNTTPHRHKNDIQGLRKGVIKWHSNDLAIELNLNMNKGSSKTGKKHSRERN